MTMPKGKAKRRLTISDRINIQGMLELRKPLAEIAGRVGCSRSTVLREIKKNSTVIHGDTNYRCSGLDRLKVCNLCRSRPFCKLEQVIYEFSSAQHKAEERMSITRQTPKLAPSVISEISDIVAGGVDRGQSLHHIYIANPNLRSLCSEQTIRRLCYSRRLKTKPHELRRYVVYRHSYERPLIKPRIDRMANMVGRTHQDYVNYTGRHKRASVVQFDSVIGRQADHLAILTVTWMDSDFQIGFVILKDDPQSANKALAGFLSLFTPEERKALFEVCISDNGPEFSYFWRLDEKFPGIHCFYTRPYKSTDKPECERNHEFIRYVHPKSTTLDGISQDELDELFSNINSYVRKAKGDRTPYRIMERKYGAEAMSKFRVRKIALKKVSLSTK